MTSDQATQFLASQVFNLIALESVRPSSQLNEAAKVSCEEAMFVVTSTIDKILTEFPSLEAEFESIVKSFEIPTQVTHD